MKRVRQSGEKSASGGEYVKRWAAGLFIALFFLYNQCGCIAEDETSALAACVMEMTTGRVLFSHNPYAQLPMASTTKVMTALLALENGSPQDKVTCSERAFGVPGTSIYLAQGETLSLADMLLGLMLASGNDAATAIAEYIGGSVDGFAEMMNERAKALGANHTRFVNPHGLPDENHYTTALDLTLIAREAMRREDFRQIVSRQTAQIPWEGRSYMRQLRNKNRLLSEYPGATGIKTGYTSRAGRCLVFGAVRGEMEVVGVVLNCADWFDEAERILDVCFERYTMVRMLEPTQSAGELAVLGGQKESVDLCLMRELCAPMREGESAQIVFDVPQEIHAPVYPGMRVGTARLMLAGETLCESEVVASEGTPLRSAMGNVLRIAQKWTML